MKAKRIIAVLAFVIVWMACASETPVAPVEEEASPGVVLSETAVVTEGQMASVETSVYELVRTPLDWKSAKKAARRMVASGCKVAHLATITSAEEQAVVSGLMAGSESNAWLGGFQPRGELSTDQGWRWSTGPRWVYTHWANNEPNDGEFDGEPAIPGSEQHLETLFGDHPPGRWNDAPGFEEKFFVVESEHCN